MLILILGLAFVAMIAFMILSTKTKSAEKDKFSPRGLFWSLGLVFGSIVFSMIIAICCLVPKIAEVAILDEKIAMYQEENEKIEEDIDKIVKEYLKHEQDTFVDLKTEQSSITLLTLLPELKSDNLVQQQLKSYLENNEKIKSLKEKKIDISKLKFILYFGK